MHINFELCLYLSSTIAYENQPGKNACNYTLNLSAYCTSWMRRCTMYFSELVKKHKTICACVVKYILYTYSCVNWKVGSTCIAWYLIRQNRFINNVSTLPICLITLYPNSSPGTRYWRTPCHWRFKDMIQ